MAAPNRPNQNDSHFHGGGVFTTGNPKSVDNLPNKPAWVAVQANNGGKLEGGITQADVDRWKSQGIRVYVWAGGVNRDSGDAASDQSKWNQSAIDAAKSYGADGVIFQGETPTEMAAAQDSASKTDMPVAIVGNPSLVAPGSWNPNVTAMPEAYLNANPYESVPNMIATSQRAGAVDVVPIYGYYGENNVKSSVPFDVYDEQAQKLGVGNFGVFNAETISSNPTDSQALSNRLAHPGSTGPLPVLASPDKAPTPVFGGVTTFVSNSPGIALPLAGTIDGVAVKVGGGDGIGGQGPSPDVLNQYKTAGVRRYVWADPAANDLEGQRRSDQNTIAIATQYGVEGIILPAMDDAQLQAAKETAANSPIPVAIITNKNMLSKMPAGSKVLLLGDGMTPQEMAQVTASNPNIVPVIPAYDNPTAGTMVNTDHSVPNYLGALGGGNVAIFTLESAAYDPTNRNAIVTYLVDKTTGKIVAVNPPTGAAAPGADTGAAGSTVHHGQGQQAAPKKPEEPMGINNPASHFAAGTKGAPPIYDDPHTTATPIMDPAKTFSFTGATGKNKGKRITITTTSTGARIEQVDGQKAYQIGAPTVPKRAPSWHANPDWHAPTAEQAAAGVLEVRPGAPGTGNTVLRMSDGTYKVVHPDGKVTSAGNWDPSHWTEPGSPGASSGSGSGESTPPPSTPVPEQPGQSRPQQQEQSAAAIAQNANEHPAEVEHLAIGPAGPSGPPVRVDPPPESNPVANFNPSVVGGFSEN